MIKSRTTHSQIVSFNQKRRILLRGKNYEENYFLIAADFICLQR